MALGRQMGREAAIYLVGFIGVGIVQFVALPIYSRFLGPEQFGLFSLATATTAVLAGIMVVGGDVALARFWADVEDHDGRRQLASTWIAFLTVWSIIIALVACAAAPFLADLLRPGTDFSTLLIAGFAAMVPTQLSRMLAQVLRNSFRPVAYSALLILNAVLDVAFALLLGIGFDGGVVGILAGIAIGETLGSLLRLPFVKQYLGWDFDWALLPPLLRFGIPFIPASLAAWALRGADRVVLSAHVDAETLGQYALAVSLVAPFAMMASALGQAWIPRIAEINVRDTPAAGRATSAAINWSLAGFGIAAMLAGAVAPLVVRIVGGPQFSESAEVLPLLALGASLTGVGLFTSTGLTLAKATRAIPLVTAVAALADLALLALLVPIWGPLGAAATVAAANLFLALATLYAANRVFPIDIDVRRAAIMVLLLVIQAWVCTQRWNELLVVIATVGGVIGLLALAPRRSRPLS